MPDDETMVRQRLLRLVGGQDDPLVRVAGDPAAGPLPAVLRPAQAPFSGDAPPDSPARWDSPAPLPDSVARPLDSPVPPLPGEPSGEDGPPRLPGPGAFDPGRRGVKALALVAVLVVLVAAGWAWRSRPRTEGVAGPSASAPAFEPAGADRAGTDQVGTDQPGNAVPPAGAPGVPADGAEIVVAVAGKVRRPGLVRLPAGARVADALEAAGGPLPGTDVALLNLARKVTDGELILVAVTAPPGAGAPGVGAPGGPAGGAGPGANGAAGTGGKVSLNTATLAELDALPGVGPVLAQRIIDHREQRGGFRAISDLRQVTGIGDARYEELKSLVTL